ncbi:hypothetical protein SLS55_010561 [Diplodia seriata]|uniref:Uncharacterized protein n=1 Tax=Diplodia seriata TaxID=420778 RepID=A0ABR3BZ31_9PEZI
MPNLASAVSSTANYLNSTATPQITPSPTSDWYWSKLYVSTTLTAATKYIVINRKTNTTSTKIVYADLPEGFTLPPTDAAGTQAVVTTFGDLSTTIAYPTPYLSWASGYSWSGTLPTLDEKSQSVCSTVTGKASTTQTITDETQSIVRTQYKTETYDNGSVSISTDFDYDWVPEKTRTTSYETSTYATVLYGDTFQRTVPPADSGDQYGFLYTLVKNDTRIWPKSIETDAAYLSCSTPTYPAPAEALMTASFVTETSTSFEDGDDSPTTEKPTTEPKPTTSPEPEETTSPEPEETTSPTQPPATDADTSPAQQTTKPPSPASTAEAPPPNTALPSGNQETTNVSPPETVGTTANPPPSEASPSLPAAAPTASTEAGGDAGSVINQPPPSTFETVNIPTTDADGSSTSAAGIVIGSQTQPIFSTFIPAATQQSNSAVDASSGAPAASPSSIPVIVVGTQTLSAGQTATIGTVPVVVPVQTPPDAVSGDAPPPQTASSAPLQVVPVQQPSPSSAAVTLANGATAIVNSASQVVVGGQTLQPGANTVSVGGGVGGTGQSAATVVLTTNAAGSSVIVAAGTTAALPPTQPPQVSAAGAESAPAITLANGATASLNSASQVVVAGQTLQPGANTVSVAGENGNSATAAATVVLTTNAAGTTVVVADGSTAAFLPTNTNAPADQTASAIVLPGGQTASLLDGTVVVVDGQTLSAGANTIAAAGTSTGDVVVTVTTDAAGNSVVVGGGGTATLPTADAGSVVTAVATLAGGLEVVVATAAAVSGSGSGSTAAVSGYVVDGTVLTSGTNVVGGQTVVLTTDKEGGTVVVEGSGAGGSGSRTVALTGTGRATETGEATEGLGGLILSGLGASKTGTAEASKSKSSGGSASSSASASESGSTGGEETGSATASGGAASATQSDSAAAVGRGGSGWAVLVEGAVLAMCLVFGAVLL